MNPPATSCRNATLDSRALLLRIRDRIDDLRHEIEELETAARVIEDVVEDAGKVAVIGRIIETVNDSGKGSGGVNGGGTRVFPARDKAAVSAIAAPTNKTADEVIADEMRTQKAFAKGDWSGGETAVESTAGSESGLVVTAAKPPCPAQRKTPAPIIADPESLPRPARSLGPRYRWQRAEVALRAIGSPSRPLDIAREMQRRGLEANVSETRLASWLSVTMQCKEEIFRRDGGGKWRLAEWEKEPE